jgi:hypothetical protein
MVFGCDDISKLLQAEDEIEQACRKLAIDDLVEEYTAKLDYLLAIRTLVKNSIPLDFYA